DPKYYETGTVLEPLFQINPSVNKQYNNWVGNAPGSGATQYIGQYHDTTRNPYFNYQPYQKIGNVVTTRSNCFAIWITVGYFEVEENIPPNAPTPTTVVFDAAHPDGYRLAQEIGYDTGEVVRHRSFFIVDRSIPVGFIPGSRLNTDDCILVRRLIE